MPADDRLDRIIERVTRVEEWKDGHEKLCAERHKTIKERTDQIKEDLQKITSKIEDIKNDMDKNSKVYILLAMGLFGIEFSKATIPPVFELLMKIVPIAHGMGVH